ncbi:MAG: hypothetical protein R3321_07365 [Nitrososphaeraceae archaeon]|nr:hypothetical protein [Nitrososphaeraceae archaeon]
MYYRKDRDKCSKYPIRQNDLEICQEGSTGRHRNTNHDFLL